MRHMCGKIFIIVVSLFVHFYFFVYSLLVHILKNYTNTPMIMCIAMIGTSPVSCN